MKRIVYIALLGLSATAYAQTDAFDAVVETIVNSNGALSASALSATADRLEQEGENRLESPGIDFAHVWGMHGIGNKMQLDVTQGFDWPGVYGARNRAARSAEAAALGATDAARADMAAEVRAQLNELVYVRRQLQVLTELRKSFQTLSEAIDKGVKGGELTAIDQRKMQIETYEIDSQIAAVKTSERRIVATLQGMSGKPLSLDGITDYPVQQQLPLGDYLTNAAADPAVRASMLAADSEAQKEKVAKMERYPGFSAGYQFQHEMGDTFNGFTVGITLPIYKSGKVKAAAASRKLAAEQEAESTLNARRAEIEATYARLDSDRDRLEAYKRTFGDNKYTELLMKAYEGGEMSVIEYLSEIHYYHQTMLTYLETEFDYNNALTQLNRNR